METIIRLHLLDADECEKVCRQVDVLKAYWIQRIATLPYYTLGAASYLDAAQDPELYARRAAEYNPLLLASFAWLYDRIKAALSAQFDADFVYAPETARPGFHIFNFHEQFKKPIASIHFDRQHEDIPWRKADEIVFSNPLSFTLSICLPQGGGGLNTWDISWENYQNQWFLGPEMAANSRPLCYVPYTAGELLVHSGNLLHQIAPAVAMQPEDRRITLQGHALPRRGVYQMYW